MRQATSLDMIGIVRQIDLNFVVASFFPPAEQTAGRFLFLRSCVLAFPLFPGFSKSFRQELSHEFCL